VTSSWSFIRQLFSYFIDGNILCLFYVVSSAISPTNPLLFFMLHCCVRLFVWYCT